MKPTPHRRGPRTSKTALRPNEYAQLFAVLSDLWRADLSLSVFMHVQEGGLRVFATTPTDPTDRVIRFAALPDEKQASRAVYAAHAGMSEGVPNVRAQRRVDQARVVLTEARRKGLDETRLWVSTSNLGAQQVLPATAAKPGPAWTMIKLQTAMLDLEDYDLLANITFLACKGQTNLPTITVRVLKET